MRGVRVRASAVRVAATHVDGPGPRADVREPNVFSTAPCPTDRSLQENATPYYTLSFA